MNRVSELVNAQRLSRRRLAALTATGAAALSVPALLRGATVRAQENGDAFVVANEAEPASLLPWFGGFGASLVTRQMYETLAEPRMELDANGAVQITFEPVLAERWERTDDLTWRVSLRQGVTFHNGEPWNADAAVASATVMGDTELTNRLGAINLLGRSISAVEKVDEYTVDFISTAPNSELMGMIIRLGFVGLPAGALAEQGVESFAEQPIGTGPYQFTSWNKGQDLTLTRFEGYWNPDGPKMPVLRYIARPEAAVRAQTIAAGEAHFAFNIGAQQASTIENSVTGGGFQSTSLRLNNAIAPTNDLRVRQAINYAIDRQAIVDAIFNGQAVPAAFFGFQPVTLEPYAYDPEQAAALIEEAGVAGTEVELVYGEGRVPEEDQLAEIYQASLEAIGLKVKLTKVEPAQYNEIGGQEFAQQPPIYMETTSSGNYAEIAGGLQDKYGCEGTGTYCNPEMDDAYLDLYLLDGEARVARLQEIAEQLHAEAPRAWVAVIQQVHGLAPNVTTTFPLNAYVRFQDISVQ
jgi:peptide/nickel transport system substrate-binding protein